MLMFSMQTAHAGWGLRRRKTDAADDRLMWMDATTVLHFSLFVSHKFPHSISIEFRCTSTHGRSECAQQRDSEWMEIYCSLTWLHYNIQVLVTMMMMMSQATCTLRGDNRRVLNALIYTKPKTFPCCFFDRALLWFVVLEEGGVFLLIRLRFCASIN